MAFFFLFPLLLKIDFLPYVMHPDFSFSSFFFFQFFPISPPMQIHSLSVSHWETHRLLRDENTNNIIT